MGKPKRSRTYRLEYTYDGGMTTMQAVKTIVATTDKEALGIARKMIGSNYFTLEQYREIKVK